MAIKNDNGVRNVNGDVMVKEMSMPLQLPPSEPKQKVP